MRGLVLIAGVLAISPPAWAKYDPCGHGSVFEPGGRVPRNAKVWLWRGGSLDGRPLRIRGPGTERAIEPPYHGSRRGLAAFDPGLLEEDETYRIELVDPLGRAWTWAELATGGEIDRVPPRPPRFDALAIAQLVDPRDPDEADRFDWEAPASDLATALDLSDDTVALEVAFDDSDERFLVPRDAPGLLGSDRCGPQRRFTVGARVCMSIRAIDLAGNRSDPATRCATVAGRIGDTSRGVHAHAWPARRPDPPDRRPGWLAIAALAAWASAHLASRRLAAAHRIL